MSSRSTSRVYNPIALEAWFENVGLDWESYFAPETLRAGRELYRQGKISGIELDNDEAIVNCTFERKDTCYAVIEWSAKGPKVRSSTEDMQRGRAVAVAGLYEIEELIADEIEPLAYEAKGERQAEDDERPIQMEPKAAELVEDARQPRRLTPRLEGIRSGLRMNAYWVNPDGSREPALQGDASVELVSEEREALVRLTGLAKDAGFVFRGEHHDFLMSNAERIAPYLKRTLKCWEDSFGFVDLDYEARQMADGVREVKIIGRVESAGQDTMRVDWRLKLGRKWLEPEDAERIAKAGRGTHVVKGLGLVRLNDEQTDALAEWRVAAASHSEEAQTWPRYMVFSLFGERGAHLDLEDELQQWRGSLTPNASDVQQLDLPDFLRPYQAHGVQWMSNLRRHSCHGLLADEMGLGKTLQVLTLLHASPVPGKSSLIVCPASVVPVWESEAARWYPEMDTAVLRSNQTFDDVGAPKLWIASYTQLRRHKHLLDSAEFGYAVLDEAQYIKNPDAKVTHACCAIQAECRIALTGTPLENRLLDLWTLFRFLMPGLLGNRRRFEDAVELEDSERRAQFEERLRMQIAPFLLRRKKDAVGADLPAKVEMDLICPISDLQRQVYEGLLNKGREELGDDLQAAMQSQATNFFTLLTRLRQACCDPGLIPEVAAPLEQSGKIQTLLIHLEEALEGAGARKVVIFSQFVQLLTRLKPEIKAKFPKVALLELTGQTRDRSKPVETFQNKDGPAVILVSLRAGGTGITLHAADYVFLLDPWWNPAVENQAVDRVHRIGQQKRVFVYRMITQGTIEERIQHLKREKRELFENTLGNLGSAQDLKEHFNDLEELARLLPAE
ncbi:DEAD/DEAH box helicase [Coraliomargarita akajimensis]|uniref:SNF2-related protein n=1 Tax=Coraliomargarita akajimensis (strain DSM 45221 / IAM 15411 / JCM 23193 / KCTC 12865 / 04OKA010-24) TaxID=583355 RepID=D5EMW5_CORAD|nr:DEAD/DEAH box helicase [Coraliomargarita akajimensis]ADE55355.1 SNF2-related protein [Coraliomargarita akajimensis DSM 45221]